MRTAGSTIRRWPREPPVSLVVYLADSTYRVSVTTFEGKTRATYRGRSIAKALAAYVRARKRFAKGELQRCGLESGNLK